MKSTTDSVIVGIKLIGDKMLKLSTHGPPGRKEIRENLDSLEQLAQDLRRLLELEG